MFKTLFGFISLGLYGTIAQAQIGNVIWEDNFDTFNTDILTPNVGDGYDEGIYADGVTKN